MSDLQNWLARRLDTSSDPRLPSFRVTSRLDFHTHEKLMTLAEAMEMSKTACAEEILSHAVSDAFNLYTERLEPGELDELKREMELSLVNALEGREVAA
jgi:predicted transcriptional regulator